MGQQKLEKTLYLLSFAFAVISTLMSFFPFISLFLIIFLVTISIFLRIIGVSPSKVIQKTRNILIDVSLGLETVFLFVYINFIREVIVILFTQILTPVSLFQLLIPIVLFIIIFPIIFPLFDRWWLNQFDKKETAINQKEKSEKYISEIKEGILAPTIILALFPLELMLIVNVLFALPRLTDFMSRSKNLKFIRSMEKMDIENKLYEVLPDIVHNKKGLLKLWLPMSFILPAFFYSFLSLYKLITTEWILPYFLLISPGILSVYLINTKFFTPINLRKIALFALPLWFLLFLSFFCPSHFLFTIPSLTTYASYSSNTKLITAMARANFAFLMAMIAIPTYLGIIVSLGILIEESSTAQKPINEKFYKLVAFLTLLGIGIIGYFTIVYVYIQVSGWIIFISPFSLSILIVSVGAGIFWALMRKKMNIDNIL